MRKSVYPGPCGECGLVKAVKCSGRSQGFESDWLVVNSSHILVVCLWTYVCWTSDLNLFICKMRLVTFVYWVVVKMYWIQDERSTWQSAWCIVVLWWAPKQSHSERSATFVPLQGLWGRQRVPVGECATRGAGRSHLCVFSLIASPPTPWISVSSSVKWGIQSLSCILHGAILRIMKTKGFGMMMEMKLTLSLAQGGTSFCPQLFFF